MFSLANPAAEDEVVIDSILKEINENLLPIKDSQSSDDKSTSKNEQPIDQKEEKMEIDKEIKKEVDQK